jgi:hypothetical protein
MSLPRKSNLGEPIKDAELDKLIETRVRGYSMSEADARKQMASFIYGNAPRDSRSTKESARKAADSVLMRPME